MGVVRGLVVIGVLVRTVGWSFWALRCVSRVLQVDPDPPPGVGALLDHCLVALS